MLKVFKCLCAAGLGLALVVALPGWARAQMFSVGDDQQRFRIPLNEFYFGYEPLDVNYYGDSADPSAGSFAFEDPILRIGYKSPVLSLFLGAGGRITGLENVSYFDFGGNLNFGLRLYGTEHLRLQLPIQIASRFTNMTNDRFVRDLDRFRFGSITGSVGAGALVRTSDRFRFEVQVLPGYGSTFASGGLFGGELSTLMAEARLYFDRLFDDFGMSVGYKYDYRNYNIDEGQYDYKMKAHSLQLGITF